MSTSKRAAFAMTDRPIDAHHLAGGSLLLAHADTAPEDGAISLDRRETQSRPADIGAGRIRMLAERLAGDGGAGPADDDNRSLDDTDEVIEPVSLAVIAAMRRLHTPDEERRASSHDTPPASRGLVVASEVSSHDAAASIAQSVSPYLITPPLALSPAAQPSRDLATIADGGLVPERFDAPNDGPLIRRIAQSAEQALMLPDHSATDIRLVDLIRRQQTLLDRLQRFPPTSDTSNEPENTNVDAASPPAPLAITNEPTIVERLAPPPLELTYSNQAAAASAPTSTELALEPPPIPLSSGAEARRDDNELLLPERSPIIIERARAERSGLYDPNNVLAPSSAVPAFAAGLALALAVAGTLFYLL